MVGINAEGWRALKMPAVENDTTLNALAVEAFNDLLKKHGKRQSVENPPPRLIIWWGRQPKAARVVLHERSG
jgi:hypothetical protein